MRGLDPDRTILVPRPGGQVKRPPAPASVNGEASIDAPAEWPRPEGGLNPLVGAANPLLAPLAQLRAATSHPGTAVLRRRLIEGVKAFEASAAESGVAPSEISAARYLLCSFIDEVVEATPWGAGGVWAEHNLLQEFHGERWGGDKVFKLLEKLGEDVAGHVDLLELFYVCLALGFEGRYRGVANGQAQLDAIADRVLQVTRPAKNRHASRTLSLRWQGVDRPARKALPALPLWAGFALGGALLLGGFLWLNARLDAVTRPVFQQIHAVPAALAMDRSAAAAKPRLAPLLQGDIDSAAIAVRDDVQRSVITLPADALFVAGSARIAAGQIDLLRRIAQALKGQPGQIVVIGHTDDTHTASLQFPSNWHLSRERALAVLDVLAQQGHPSERLRAEGRADVEPLVPNDSPQARARNRRIDIELMLPRPDG
jgi:type VI secretion system protein ImpK